MFDSLADQIKHDEHEQTSNRERWIRYAVIAVLSVALFVALYMGVQNGRLNGCGSTVCRLLPRGNPSHDGFDLLRVV